MTKSHKLENTFYDISEDIWNRKYRYKGNEETPEDKSIEETMRRVAINVSKDEKDQQRWQKAFEDILLSKAFLPGGRIIANAGTQRTEVTMFNCYVMNTIEDSIEGIFDTVKDSAVTQKQGGGVGFDFSTLRPRDSHIKGCEAKSSGPLSFMQVLDSTCRTIMSAGQRRGAQMGVMRCDHPDIEDFITAKRNNDSLQMFNLSVAITDKFINAVKNNEDWELIFDGVVYRTIRAVELWDLIMKSTYDFAEPGFILIDKINEMNNLYYVETIAATNPCGEQPLPPFGACLLGSLNLTKFVKDSFTNKAEIDFDTLAAVTSIAVRLLDNVIDISGYPLEQQKHEAKSKRRMGIGITGLADMMIFLGVRYGSAASLEIADKVMETIMHAAYRASVEIAREKGSFPLFNKDAFCKGKFISQLPSDIIDGIKQHGLRNSHLTSIAPTGTISLLSGNVSSGLEPVFAFSYNRKIRNGHENDITEVEVSDYAYRKYCELKNKHVDEKDLPKYFVTSEDISPEEHINIQAILQKNVDSSISKTINIPADYPFDKFKDLYLYAHSKGLKGCTTFRPSEFITGVLTKKDDGKKKDEIKDIGFATRPTELEGTTYKIKTPLSPDALYLTINDLVENNNRRPYELFINTKNLQQLSWIVAMTRLISAVFRKEPDPSFLVEELKSIYDPNGGYFSNGRFVPSLAAEIGLVIEQHLRKIGILEGERKKTAELTESQEQHNNNAKSNLMICPQCNDKGLYSAENCLKCILCGYSKCG